MAKSAEKKYVVADRGYLYKEGTVYQTGKEISLTDEEHKNVAELVHAADSNEGKILIEQHKEADSFQEEEKTDSK